MAPIDQLTRMVAPPSLPVGSGGDWGYLEAELGTSVPADYIQLFEHYGRGKFVDFCRLLDPFGPVEWRDVFTAPSLVASARLLLDQQGPIRADFPDSYPYPLFPERGGLLQWAVTDNGDYLCWLTNGQPDNWQIIVWDSRRRYEKYDIGAVDFLQRWFGGHIDSAILPRIGRHDLQFAVDVEIKKVYVKVSPGELPYGERLQILKNALAPVSSEESRQTNDGRRMDRFIVAQYGWDVTYETINDHQICIKFAPRDESLVRITVAAAVESMGCHIAAVLYRGQTIWT